MTSTYITGSAVIAGTLVAGVEVGCQVLRKGAVNQVGGGGVGLRVGELIVTRASGRWKSFVSEGVLLCGMGTRGPVREGDGWLVKMPC